MLFNTPQFIFLFLPVTVLIYFLLNRYRMIVAGKAWLVLASLFFYGYWKAEYLTLMLSSILVNFALGQLLAEHERHSRRPKRKTLLVSGLLFNLGLLGFFKYADFTILNFNWAFETEIQAMGLLLPLAISFFTFQQIAYLVDSYQGKTKEYDFLTYCLFVTFFPQLIAGPIVHHKQMMPQFQRLRNKFLNYPNLAMGLYIFCIGLMKKLLIADAFAIWANSGFDSTTALNFFDAWAVSLSYTFQLYYDFSGYSDMAIGAALMFNIQLPYNFNSPYKAKSIQDFWRRWHITLSTWLRDYLYIPLGGSRKGNTYFNVFLTMLLGGLWHGAGWTFILWGAMHGAALALHRFWNQLGLRMPGIFGWFLTFGFLNFTWVFFRSTSLERAIVICKGMLGMNGVYVTPSFQRLWNLPESAIGWEWHSTQRAAFLLFVIAIVTLVKRNSIEVQEQTKTFRIRNCIFVGLALFLAIQATVTSTESQFLYFNF